MGSSILADDDKWDIDSMSQWIQCFRKVFSEVRVCIFPYSMFKTMPKITGKEYTMLNNILKRCKDSKENYSENKQTNQNKIINKTINEMIDDIYANEQQCDFCIYDDECPHGMVCYGGDPIEPPCCNGYEKCFDEDKYYEYLEK